MPIQLFRVDERLIHGQVLVGWGARLGISRYVIVDDELATSEWEQELYASALPEGVTVEFLSTDEALARFEEIDCKAGRGALLTRDTAAMRRLAEAGLLEGRRVNIGGLHSGPGRRKVLDYVYLGDRERDDLVVISRRGGHVSARDLPTAPEVPLDHLVSS